MRRDNVIVRMGVLACVLMLAGSSASSQETDYTPMAPDNPTIERAELTILVRPLTIEELQIEADAWVKLVKQKVQEIADAEVAVQIENAQERAQREAEKAAEEAAAEGDAQDTPAETPPTDEELAADAALERASAARERLEAEEAAVEATEPETRESESESEEAAEVAPQPSDKERFLEHINKLREERVALNDRAVIVLNELDRKGGDSAAQRKYLSAVAGIRVNDAEDWESLWATVVGWAKSTEGGLRLLRNVAKFLGILFAFLVVSRVAGKAAEKGLGRTRNVTQLMREFVVKGVRRVILGVGVIVALSALGVNIGPLLALIGAAGFVVAFALQDTLSNFASGIMILVYRPFDVGDVVDVASVSGTVNALNLVSVTIKTFDNKTIIVPNNEVWNNVITNATNTLTRRVDMVFGIGYGDDMAKAQSILEEIVTHHPDTLKDPEPVIKVNELAESSVNFICRPWVRTENYWKVYWDITRTVKERFDAEGISIPFPQRDVHIHQTGG